MLTILSGNFQVIANNLDQLIPLSFVTMLIDIEINRFILWWKVWIRQSRALLLITQSLVYLLYLLDLLFFPPISRREGARVFFLDPLLNIFSYLLILLSHIKPLQCIMHVLPFLMNYLFHLLNLPRISFS